MKLLKDYQCIWRRVVFECWSGLNVNVPYRYSYWNTRLWLVVLFWVGFGGVALLEAGFGVSYSTGHSHFTVSVLCLSTTTM